MLARGQLFGFRNPWWVLHLNSSGARPNQGKRTTAWTMAYSLLFRWFSVARVQLWYDQRRNSNCELLARWPRFYTRSFSGSYTERNGQLSGIQSFSRQGAGGGFGQVAAQRRPKAGKPNRIFDDWLKVFSAEFRQVVRCSGQRFKGWNGMGVLSQIYLSDPGRLFTRSRTKFIGKTLTYVKIEIYMLILPVGFSGSETHSCWIGLDQLGVGCPTLSRHNDRIW